MDARQHPLGRSPADGLTHALGRGAEPSEDLRDKALLVVDDGEQEIFGQDRLIWLRSLNDEFEELYRLMAEYDLQRLRLLFARRDDLPDLRAHSLQREPELIEDPHHRLVRLIWPGQACQTEKQMLGSDVAVAHADGLVLGKRERAFCAIAEAVHRARVIAAAR